MEITDKIVEWIKILKTKPKMVIATSNIDYLILRIYIEGYIDGVSLIVNRNIGKDITFWFQEKIDQRSSNYWTAHIAFYYQGKTEDELKAILLDTTEMFFLENPDWYKE
ncbi:hypothetical protein [Limnovirga soli]|uniref:Uncharacterized protein n=1 Tax=Limnovirga soli TaxID=2656915 RepID=A0A8J8FE56_9BACT|nr:hypothetical protein [Limnovirga soli]NNV55043.1 hypothetical protein [Limnovirga soli]